MSAPLPLVSMTEAGDPSHVGQKFARQQHLARHGFPVPEFFCLTTTMFQEVASPILSAIEQLTSTVDRSSQQDIRRVAEEIERLFVEVPLSAEREASILDAFDRTFGSNAVVAVRASVVGRALGESEDSESDPFAGVSSTFLYVRRDALLERIRRCWASAYTPEGLIYRLSQGREVRGLTVAVGVQRMVPGRRSFVLFTCDPKTTERKTLIVAGHGIGEGVVQEKVGVDHYFIHPQTGRIDRELGHKAEMLCENPEPGGGLLEQPVPEALRDAPCLSDAELQRLATLAKDIERTFGVPQDIEGTFTEDGTLHVLQSRPIAFDFRKIRVWGCGNVSESFPGVTTPLTYSLASHFYEVIFYDLQRRMWGADARTLHDHGPAFQNMLGFIDGRVYHSLSNLMHVNGINPFLAITSMRDLEDVLQLDASLVIRLPGHRESFPSTASYAFALGRSAAGALAATVSFQRDFEKYAAWWKQTLAGLRTLSLSREDPLVLIHHFRQVWREVGNWWGLTLINHWYINSFYGLASRFLRKWTGEDPSVLLAGLLCGAKPDEGSHALFSAVALAETVRADAALAKLFADDEAEAVWSRIASGEVAPAFARAFREHLSEYGDRGVQELNVERPNLRDTPWELVRIVQSYARTSVTRAELRTSDVMRRTEAETQLAVLLKGQPLRKLVVQQLLERLRTVIGLREDSRFWRGQLFGFSKSVFAALGQRMAERGVFDSPLDVHYLTMKEVFDHFEGRSVTRNLGELVRLRRREQQDNQERQPPRDFTTVGSVADGVPRAVEVASDDASLLKGLGSSAGIVEGFARIVKDPGAVGSLCKDDILIAKETDPGWLFLMLASGGIVVERGSMLSHTAIAGRKFGIPTVVGVAHATTRIPDGARIRVDGSTGTVTVVST
ncbi:phosphoenolpyruvate synthase [Corallococcus praedator]|uniref:Phosphoenolpyruvate synthase n=1 Tax=Corallococcus praedator TaxID=2316724 RepID=A0ABX9QMK3_9BACT|nr:MULTISPECIES: PEP/pyruvate-binding domain-containing protein [Corallococcus]RKH32893.1 phosphoenolpyruvate synthase [Corallococcus sp. CA031C]RKI13687.1 phosphoenolpyruvate synthase [Corallococcus praedator]